MRLRYRRISPAAQALWSASLLVVVVLAVAGLVGALSRTSQPQIVPEPPRVVVQALATEAAPARATSTPRVEVAPRTTIPPSPTAVVEPPTTTPAPPTATATTAVLLPDPTAVPTSQTSPPTAQARPADPNLLPNGVRYGERKPNIPNRIVRISSPDIKLDTPVYEVYAPKGVWEVADYAGGHHFDSRNPGEGGNIVLSGHNNWRGEVFRYLEFMKPGHTINVWTLDGKKYTYKVQELKKVQEAGVSMAQRLQNAKVMSPTPAEQLTLITCWPYKTFTHRIIIIATPVE